MILWLLIGVAIGWFFKPQIDRGVHKVVRMIRNNRNDKGSGPY